MPCAWLSWVAPVTRRSGKSCIVVRRYACNKRLDNALYHWARVVTQHDSGQAVIATPRCAHVAIATALLLRTDT